MSEGVPPKSPEEFNPDSGVTPEPTRRFEEETYRLRFRVSTNAPPFPRPPGQFNPDPGSWQKEPPPEPLFDPFFGVRSHFGEDSVPPALRPPRDPVRRRWLEPEPAAPAGTFGLEPLPAELRLPRARARANEFIEHDWHNPHAAPADGPLVYPPGAVPMPNRWRVPYAHWRRYDPERGEQPYQDEKLHLWHPYRQSLLKGDAPIIGQDIFLNLTAASLTEFEARRLPTPSGVSAARPGSVEFYGRSDNLGVQQFFSFGAELFEGEAAFKPVHWAVKFQPVFNLNYLHSREAGVVAPDPRGIDGGPNPPRPDIGGIQNPGDIDGLLGGDLDPATGSFSGRRHTTRTKNYVALQEWFAELHLGDLSVNYDFFAFRLGNQVFNSDFRGFIFNDVNLGARLFGNYDNNHLQYNLAFFDLREKETFSELNTFERRGQQVLIANVYRQDFLWKGYTAQLSFHANWDEGDPHYDRAGFIIRPAPLGTVRPHDVHAYYLGWAGDGHIGRWNLSHAVYQVFGRDEFNGLAGRPVEINAQMAALELSYDRDWIRYKASLFYASGDDDAEDGRATGFDSILDNPNFTGGPFSYYARQGFNLGGTAVGLKHRNSLVPDLRSSKAEGQANFVNPGVIIAGLGAEIELTPKLRSFLNANYVRLAESDPIRTALLTNKADEELGWDLSLGFQYRPLLTDNIIISAGFGAFLPGQGYKDVYKTNPDPVPGFNSPGRAGRVDDFLYSGLLVLTFTY